MKEWMKKNIKYVLLFILFLIAYLFLPKLAADETWSYGFAYNVASGLIPYRDFNMIVPPFFAHLFSIGLIFYKGILMFEIEQALLMTLICYLLEKILKEKYLYLTLLLLVLPVTYNLPTYNTLCFFFLLLLIFLEKNKSGDLLIGVILGLSCLTKQTIGFSFLLVGIYCAKKSPVRLKLRLFGFLLPIIGCSIYLMVINSFFLFIDQCFLGMLDFTENTKSSSLPIIIAVSICLLLFLLYLKKHKQQDYDLYPLAFYIICYPLFDMTHFLMGLFGLLVFILQNQKIPYNRYIRLSLWLMIIAIPICNAFSLLLQRTCFYPNDVIHHEYRYIDPYSYDNLKKLRQYHLKHKNQDIIILSSPAYLYKLSNQLPIGKLDLMNKGNFGYQGTKKAIREIKKTDRNKTLFLINPEELSELMNNQIDKEVLRFVIKHGTKIDKVLYFDVYRLNS